MQSTFIKRSKKFFNLNPELLDMKDNDSQLSRKSNWGCLFAELKKFGLEMDQTSL